MAGRVQNKLNVREVEALIKASRPGRYSDGGGLFLDISAKGTTTWTFIYRSPTHKVPRHGRPVGKTREKGLGSATLGSVRKEGALSRARKMAQAAREQLREGVDPLDAPPVIARAIIPTFECLAETVCKGLEPGWRNGKTAARWRSNISIHARTLLDKPVDQITTTDVEEVLRPIWTTHAETASQLRGHIERIMAAAKVNGFRSGENPAHGWIIGVNKMSQDRIGSEATLKNRNGVRQSSGAVRGGVMM